MSAGLEVGRGWAMLRGGEEGAGAETWKKKKNVRDKKAFHLILGTQVKKFCTFLTLTKLKFSITANNNINMHPYNSKHVSIFLDDQKRGKSSRFQTQSQEIYSRC